MTEEQRARVDLLFEQASALPAPERRAFLDAAGADPDVVGEVASLLEYAALSTGTVPSAVEAMVAHVTAQTLPEGKRIGAYRIGREIGRGGMGAVYLASRDDDFRRTVALKILPFGMHTPSAVRRFRQERQILAELEHPNIARLLDGGTTDEELPYLVMEYIDGVPITEYGARLTLPHKLKLFRQLCDGVQWAHQKLVIHRDIKPGNILVGSNGVPKLLDFGIAKLLAVDAATEEAGAQTRTMGPVMTPGYASPEQVRGQAVTVASDVYGLGAVLFELLTGERAHQLTAHTQEELARQICETPVRKPSTTRGASPKGDLDNIVLKAMHKDPERRYNSAEQLSEDIRRYLEDLPVIARPDTLVYRSRKFARRNWPAVTAVGAVIVSLGAGLLAARQQAQLAESRFAEGRRLAGRLFEIHDNLKRLPGSTESRELVVRSALEYLDRLAPTAGNDPGFEWELAKAYEKTGDAQGSPSEPSLGRTKDAAASYQKAIRLEENLLARGLLSVEQRQSLAGSYKRLSLLNRAAGDGQAAVGAAGKGVALAEGGSPATLASAYTELAAALQLAGDPAGAAGTILKSLALHRQMASGKPDASPEMERLTGSQLVAARAMANAARFDDALALARDGIGFRERRRERAPDDAVNARELVLTYMTAADVLGAVDRPSLGDHAGALPYYRAGLAVARQLASRDAHNATARFALALSAGKTATQLEEASPREAIALYREALEAAEQLTPEGPERESIRTSYYGSVARPLANLGHIDDSRSNFHQAIAMLERRVSKPPVNTESFTDLAETWRQLADLEYAQGHKEEALADSRRGVLYVERAAALSPRSVRVAWHLCQALENVAQKASEDEARQLRQRVAGIWGELDKAQPNTPYLQAQKRRAEELASRP